MTTVQQLLCNLNSLPRVEYTHLDMIKRMIELERGGEMNVVSSADVRCSDLIRKDIYGGDFVYNIRDAGGTTPAVIMTTRGRMMNPILLPLVEFYFPYAAFPVGDYIMDIGMVDPDLCKKMAAEKPERFGVRMLSG